MNLFSLFFLLYYFSFGLLDVFYVFVQGKTQEKKLNFQGSYTYFIFGNLDTSWVGEGLGPNMFEECGDGD